MATGSALATQDTLEREAAAAGLAPFAHTRAAPRIERTFVVRIRMGGQALKRALSRDVSEAGIFLLTPDPPPVGSLLECVLVHPVDGMELKVPARVVRAGVTLAGPGVGLQFEATCPTLRRALVRYVSEAPASDPSPS